VKQKEVFMTLLTEKYKKHKVRN